MLKQLWKSVEQLKTPERRLLFGLMFAAIIVLWLSFRDNDKDRKARIIELEQEVKQKENDVNQVRFTLQNKIDTCNESKLSILRTLYERTERLKQFSKDIE